jgi:hypothetical protein
MPTYENFKLTVEELRQMKGFENIEEEKALKVIETMFMMSVFAFKAYNNKEKNIMSYE